jgi:hypothetical protein
LSEKFAAPTQVITLRAEQFIPRIANLLIGKHVFQSFLNQPMSSAMMKRMFGFFVPACHMSSPCLLSRFTVG